MYGTLADSSARVSLATNSGKLKGLLPRDSAMPH
jgi:hypothetical protein